MQHVVRYKPTFPLQKKLPLSISSLTPQVVNCFFLFDDFLAFELLFTCYQGVYWKVALRQQDLENLYKMASGARQQKPGDNWSDQVLHHRRVGPGAAGATRVDLYTWQSSLAWASLWSITLKPGVASVVINFTCHEFDQVISHLHYLILSEKCY